MPHQPGVDAYGEICDSGMDRNPIPVNDGGFLADFDTFSVGAEKWLNFKEWDGAHPGVTWLYEIYCEPLGLVASGMAMRDPTEPSVLFFSVDSANLCGQHGHVIVYPIIPQSNPVGILLEGAGESADGWGEVVCFTLTAIPGYG